MTKTLEEKKYRILHSFQYSGPDGKSKQTICFGPGEPVPELDDDIKEELLAANLICEVGKDGENVLREIQKGENVSLDISDCRGLVNRLKRESQAAYRYLKQYKLTKKTLLLLKEVYDEFIVAPYLNQGGEISDLDKDPEEVDIRAVNLGLNKWIISFKQEMDLQLSTAKE